MPRPALKVTVIGALGAALVMGALAWLMQVSGNPWLMASLGATCYLVFAFPDAPFSQPRNVVLGHVIASVVGLLVLHLMYFHWMGLVLAIALAVALTMYLGLAHPPAAANPIIIWMTRPDWTFVFIPTLSGTVFIIVVALIVHNLTREARYPKYW